MMASSISLDLTTSIFNSTCGNNDVFSQHIDNEAEEISPCGRNDEPI